MVEVIDVDVRGDKVNTVTQLFKTAGARDALAAAFRVLDVIVL